MKALLVGVQLPRTNLQEYEASLAELTRLVNTLGYDVIGQLGQKRNSTEGATVLGAGKLRELAKWTDGPGTVQPVVDVKKHKAALRFNQPEDPVDLEDEPDGDLDEDLDEDLEDDLNDETPVAPTDKPDVIVFDCELSPSQMRNLESATGAKVLDRTGVIIEIFSRHARTRTAKLQVEIARLNYLAPRIRETAGSADRQGGGIGAKGVGETAYELDRRRIRDRIKELKDDLAGMQSELSVRRTRRSQENCVALVGYTNAGKSSLMRAMTSSDLYVADKLFATLDTTVRALSPESNPKVLLSDTVGFIKKLPHDLVASFRSTLDEALNADLLLFVVDASDATFRSQLEVTQTVLKEIGATERESWIILNKRDRLSEIELKMLAREFPDAIQISTRDSHDLAMLRQRLLDFFERDMVETEVFVPYTTQGAIGEVRSQMRVLTERHDELGTYFLVRADARKLERLKSKFELS